eukprot:PhM_4_TR18755/c0_g1_i1/m.17183
MGCGQSRTVEGRQKLYRTNRQTKRAGSAASSSTSSDSDTMAEGRKEKRSKKKTDVRSPKLKGALSSSPSSSSSSSASITTADEERDILERVIVRANSTSLSGILRQHAQEEEVLLGEDDEPSLRECESGVQMRRIIFLEDDDFKPDVPVTQRILNWLDGVDDPLPLISVLSTPSIVNARLLMMNSRLMSSLTPDHMKDAKGEGKLLVRGSYRYGHDVVSRGEVEFPLVTKASRAPGKPPQDNSKQGMKRMDPTPKT